MTPLEFIKMKCPKSDPSFLITEDISAEGKAVIRAVIRLENLINLMDEWADYKISQQVYSSFKEVNLNVGGGGFLTSED